MAKAKKKEHEVIHNDSTPIRKISPKETITKLGQIAKELKDLLISSHELTDEKIINEAKRHNNLNYNLKSCFDLNLPWQYQSFFDVTKKICSTLLPQDISDDVVCQRMESLFVVNNDSMKRIMSDYGDSSAAINAEIFIQLYVNIMHYYKLYNYKKPDNLIVLNNIYCTACRYEIYWFAYLVFIIMSSKVLDKLNIKRYLNEINTYIDLIIAAYTLHSPRDFHNAETMFFEDFLSIYNKKFRQELGVWQTSPAIVDFTIRSNIYNLEQNYPGIVYYEGRVCFYDFCVGTGSYVNGALRSILKDTNFRGDKLYNIFTNIVVGSEINPVSLFLSILYLENQLRNYGAKINHESKKLAFVNINSLDIDDGWEFVCYQDSSLVDYNKYEDMISKQGSTKPKKQDIKQDIKQEAPVITNKDEKKIIMLGKTEALFDVVQSVVPPKPKAPKQPKPAKKTPSSPEGSLF